MSLSFILLASPPCTPTSFRPESDATHWCRRDALSRITTQTLYSGPATPHSSCKDVTFLFSGRAGVCTGEDAELPPAALSLSPSLIATTPIPTESSLLSLWKKAAQDANKSASSGTLIASTATLSNPVLCSHTVAAEASLHFSTPSIVAPSTASASSSSFPFDKRLLLQTLQQSCPLDFLRKHGLNGSEKLILKKRNRAALEAADADWRATKQPKVDPTLQSGNLGAGQPVADQPLVDAFKTLFLRASRVSDLPFSSLSVLLLHEDFPSPLPTYLLPPNDPASPCAPHTTIVIMGAVRDMSDGENVAVIAAAHALNIRVVGANLGRVAEFTSKIACVMTAHADAGRLSPAVLNLPPITDHRIEKLESARTAAPQDAEDPRPADPPHTFAVVHPVPLLPEDVNTESARTALFPIIQLVVCTLYRSHIAREVASLNTNTAAAAVGPVSLTLVFADSTSLTIGQFEFMTEMTSRHFGAPTESHILDCLQAIIKNKPPVSPRSLPELTLALIPKSSELKKERRRRLRVLKLTIPDAAAAAPPPLAPHVYNGAASGQECDLVVLFEASPTNTAVLDAALSEWHGGKKSMRRFCADGRLFEEQKVMFPGRVITVLQQWSWLGRLGAAIDEVIKLKDC